LLAADAMTDASHSQRDDYVDAVSTDPTDSDLSRSIARSLLDIEAVKLRPADPFTWSSGLVSPIYCDNRLTLSYPRVRRAIRDGFAAYLQEQALLPATIAGTATAGIPHAAWLADAVDAPMAYVRDSAKEHGTGARIEGLVEAGDSVVLVEDLISTGGSALDAVSALRDAGAAVPTVLAIFSYQLNSAAAAFREAAVDRFVLTDFQTLIAVAHAEERLSDDDLHALKTWRTDPAAWSAEHGGAQPD
jgi:orotate phosphoribosyltransferase